MPQPEGLKPGVYVGLSMKEYHADPAIGSSGIKDLLESPLEYWWNSPLNPKREEEKTTPAKAFGTAYHTLVLEPDKFSLTVKEGVQSSTVAGMIGQGDYEKLLAMQAGLLRNPKHAALLQGMPDTGCVHECSIFWRDEETGLMCKMRCDTFAPGWISDLKTTDDICSKALRYSFVDWGYDVSGAMYSIGAHALRKMMKEGYQLPAQFSTEFASAFLGQEDQIFAFVYQGKKAPYISRLWLVTPYLAEIGYSKFRRGLDIYKKHMDIAGEWPSGYPDMENITEDMLSASINFY